MVINRKLLKIVTGFSKQYIYRHVGFSLLFSNSSQSFSIIYFINNTKVSNDWYISENGFSSGKFTLYIPITKFETFLGVPFSSRHLHFKLKFCREYQFKNILIFFSSWGVTQFKILERKLFQLM